MSFPQSSSDSISFWLSIMGPNSITISMILLFFYKADSWPSLINSLFLSCKCYCFIWCAVQKCFIGDRCRERSIFLHLVRISSSVKGSGGPIFVKNLEPETVDVFFTAMELWFSHMHSLLFDIAKPKFLLIALWSRLVIVATCSYDFGRVGAENIGAIRFRLRSNVLWFINSAEKTFSWRSRKCKSLTRYWLALSSICNYLSSLLTDRRWYWRASLAVKECFRNINKTFCFS